MMVNSMDPQIILTLEKIPGIGRTSIDKILSVAQNGEISGPADILELIQRTSKEQARVKVPSSEAVKKAYKEAENICKSSEENDIIMLTPEDDRYPKRLLQIRDLPDAKRPALFNKPPHLLHVKGNVDLLKKDSVAIIGTRDPAQYGSAVAKEFAKRFSDNYVVVSGLATGIDTAAHEGVVEKGGETIAVLAHGLHTTYPKKNKELALKILDNNGALVSEYPSGVSTRKNYFVERDRIQSGLSLGAFVIETEPDGGTMHTVGYCEAQKRGLFVLDDQGFPQGRALGNRELIESGRGVKVGEDLDMEEVEAELGRIRERLGKTGEMNKIVEKGGEKRRTTLDMFTR